MVMTPLLMTPLEERLRSLEELGSRKGSCNDGSPQVFRSIEGRHTSGVILDPLIAGYSSNTGVNKDLAKCYGQQTCNNDDENIL